jgi:hypothetical protein
MLKKILLTVLFGLGLVGIANASLWTYYTQQGEQLPPISERAVIAETCGIQNYVGSYDQNIALEKCLTEPKLGIALPNISALFETSLQNSVSSDATSMTLVSATLKNGNSLSGLYGFIIDEGASNEEFVICTASSTSLTACLRGIDPVDGKTEVATLQYSHRRGASIKITDYPILGIMRRVLNGDEGLPNPLYYDTNPDFTSASSSWLTTKGYVDNRNGYWEGAVANFAALPTGVNNGETRVTLDDSKVYVWDGSSWILAGSGGGAGTIYRDDIVVTSTAVTTYSLSSGSWPDPKYLTVYLNGMLLSLDSDYSASTTGNSIELLFTPVVGEVVTLRVESIDFYNAEWTEVNDDLLPDVDNTHDIGSTTLQFKDLYLGGNATVGGNGTFGGTLGVTGTTTLATTTISSATITNSTFTNFPVISTSTPTLTTSPVSYYLLQNFGVVSSSNLRFSADTERSVADGVSSYLKRIRIGYGGTVRVDFAAAGIGNTGGQDAGDVVIYVDSFATNCTANLTYNSYTTTTCAVNIGAGSEISAYVTGQGGYSAQIKNFGIYYDLNTTSTSFVVTD